jgi:hypothetical protein
MWSMSQFVCLFVWSTFELFLITFEYIDIWQYSRRHCIFVSYVSLTATERPLAVQKTPPLKVGRSHLVTRSIGRQLIIKIIIAVTEVDVVSSPVSRLSVVKRFHQQQQQRRVATTAVCHRVFNSVTQSASRQNLSRGDMFDWRRNSYSHRVRQQPLPMPAPVPATPVAVDRSAGLRRLIVYLSCYFQDEVATGENLHSVKDKVQVINCDRSRWH